MNGAKPEDYLPHDFWKAKRLSPNQLLVHDVKLQEKKGKTRLAIDEVPASSLMPSVPGERLQSSPTLPTADLAFTRSELEHIADLIDVYGWLSYFRVPKDTDTLKCRWIHVSSKFPEYIEGVFTGLSDWSLSPERKLEHLHLLNSSTRSNERWSKHGRSFSPFLQPLSSKDKGSHFDLSQSFLLSIPFLDWTIYPGPTPPLRFQVDEREGYASSRSSAHPLRTLLQHKYRLEETTDREKSQVYARHKPWNTDRDLDLKVRRFYGHYPSGLNVDELWVLVVDETHIVTFSSNQTWKARWPPLQLSSRIAEVSFRGLRKQAFLEADSCTPYCAMLHALVCLNGAVGLVHRSFWSDLPLPCSERYAAQLGHLQYRLYRAPSTKLVLDLLQLQDELAIIQDITKGQIDIISKLEQHVGRVFRSSRGKGHLEDEDKVLFALGDSEGLNRRLEGELQDLTELRTNTNELVTRTIQLVNIRLEDHGQAILVFTIVTVIFLPLSFLSSFFGMNVSDIRNMQTSQWIFWTCAASLTTVVVGASMFLAFYGGRLNEKFVVWKDSQSFDYHHSIRDRFRRSEQKRKRPANEVRQTSGLRLLDATQTETGRAWGLGLAAS